MDNLKKSKKIFLFELLSQVVTIAFGLALPHLFLVNYGSEVNGLLNSLQQFLVFLGLFEAGLGAATLQALYRPLALDDWDGVNGILSASSIFFRRIARLYLLGLIAISLLYPIVVDSQLSFLTVCGAAFFSGAGNVVLFYFQMQYRCLLQVDGKSYITANLNTVTTIVINLSKVVLIRLNVNIVLILAVSFLMQCLQAVYILWYIRSYPRLRLDVPPNTQALSQRNFTLFHQINYLIFQNTDVMILTVFCGLRVVSVYSVFKMISYNLETIIRIPFNSVWFILGQNYQTDKPLFIRRLDLLGSYFVALFYGLYSVALFLYLPFMRLYTAGVTDANYVDPLLAVLFVLIPLMYLGQTLAGNTVGIAGHFRQTLPFAILESTINLTVSLVGVYFWGIYGVLLGTVAALTYRTNRLILYANHVLLERSAWKTYAIYGVNIVSFALTQLLFRWIFDSAWLDSYPRLFVAGFVCTVISLLVHAGGQLLVFPHCRAGTRELLQSLRKQG